jgi:DNA-binding winged helix-turn-helix (wHTH) protein
MVLRGEAPMSLSGDVSVCGMVVRPHEHVLLVNGREIDLTSREFEIISRLAEHPGWVLSAEQLCDESEEADYSPESVSVHVSRLRHKLSTAGAEDVVETVRGSGYRLRRSDAGDGAVVPDLSGARRRLRDASWQLHEAALEAEHAGSEAQLESVADAIEMTRQTIYRILAD